jgi:hypothetical protein
MDTKYTFFTVIELAQFVAELTKQGIAFTVAQHYFRDTSEMTSAVVTITGC